MNIIRIGNDINVIWRLFSRNGMKFSLEGRILKLWLISGPFKKEITDFEIQLRNEIHFFIDADDLHRLGVYKILLSILDDQAETEDASIDITTAFQLVSKTYIHSSSPILDGSDIILSVASVLNNIETSPLEGASAYEIAVKHGYEGTEEEWLESLRGDIGPIGKSAYQSAVDNGFEGTEAEWVYLMTKASRDMEVVEEELEDVAFHRDAGSLEDLEDPSAYATRDELDELRIKIDGMSTGKYYGFHVSEEELPEATDPGYAYVGESAPYALWNFDGLEWKDSGVTVDNAPVGNEEDIDQDEAGLLKLADRPTSSNQMGYVILRNNKTFAEQVTNENTIYEIRYAFQLDSLVSLPSGCRLIFNGGAIVINGTTLTTNTIDALVGGMIPGIASVADYNAGRLVSLINAGFSVSINHDYYIGTANTPISHDVNLKGVGSLIKTVEGSASFTISEPVRVCVKGIAITGNYDVASDTTSILFKVETSTHIYLPEVSFMNCAISKVRVYSHNADDVDQTTVKDGVRRFLFCNNHVSDIGRFLVCLDNCLCEYVGIENNTIKTFKSILFSIGLDNNYQTLSFPRTKEVFIRGNVVDNNGYTMTEQTRTVYHTPFLVEAGSCVVQENTIKNITCNATTATPVYPFYLSCDSVTIQNNYMCDILNLADSTYNEIFKSKGVADVTAGAIRIITGNTFIITPGLVASLGTIPNIKFLSLQGNGGTCDLLVAKDNYIDVACNFSWGGAANIVYKNATFSGNIVRFKSLGPNAIEFLRLYNNTGNDGLIVIANNKMFATNPSGNSNVASAIREESGYKVIIKDNELFGIIPCGTYYSTSYSDLEIISEGNKVDCPSLPAQYLGNVNVFDVELRLINAPNFYYKPIASDQRHVLKFKGEKTLNTMILDWSGTDGAGYYRIDFYSVLGTRSIYCHVGNTTVYILNDAGSCVTGNRTVTSTGVDVVAAITDTVNIGYVTFSGTKIVIGFSSAVAQLDLGVAITKTKKLPSTGAIGNKFSLKSIGTPNSTIKACIAWKDNRLGFANGGKIYGADGRTSASLFGTTGGRPNLSSGDVGFIYFDSTLGKPIVWNGSAWLNMDGSALS